MGQAFEQDKGQMSWSTPPQFEFLCQQATILHVHPIMTNSDFL
jgi:hypothetical protein